MIEIVETLASMRRDLISDGYDQAIEYLAKLLPCEIDEIPTGTKCWSWTVPEKWTCRGARLERLNGEIVFSDSQHPLHVVSYSLPFDGVVTRAELFRHLHVHPILPEAIPFIFKYYKRDWGLCCARTLKDTLLDAEYRVVIDAEFTSGHLKIARSELRGDSDETVVLCAHLCHPMQANDDASGVAVAVELMRRLAKMERRHYSYLLLILPETIGSVAWLSHNTARIPTFRSGVFLEMLGLPNPHAVQLTYAGDTQIDLIAKMALSEENSNGWHGRFLRVITNDERQFNAPGIRVPMVSVSRVLSPDHPDYPYPEYHSNFDSPRICSADQLERSACFVERMLEMQERNWLTNLTDPGEPFLTRYNLHKDWFVDRRASNVLYDVMFEFDGRKSVADIATRYALSFEEVCEIAEAFGRAGAACNTLDKL